MFFSPAVDLELLFEAYPELTPVLDQIRSLVYGRQLSLKAPSVAEVVMFPGDTYDTMVDKVRMAVWWGALRWRSSVSSGTLEVRLGGLSSNPRLAQDEELMGRLRGMAQATAIVLAARFGLESFSVCVVPPQGTASQSSGP